MNDKFKARIFFGIVAVLVLALITTALVRSSGAPEESSGEYDSFVRCIKDRGAVFYGAFWCPHCQAQKKLFGSSAKLLPYVECSTLDGNAQTKVCIDKKIETYPTWEFADGSRLTGEISLPQLSEKTACILPQ